LIRMWGVRPIVSRMLFAFMVTLLRR
jgi:hypothetical protein